MQVRKASAPAQASVGHDHYYFCSDRCRERFEAQPEQYTSDVAPVHEMDGMEGPIGMDGTNEMSAHGSTTDSAVDSVCVITVNPKTVAAHRSYEGVDYWFCNQGCAAKFDADPGRYVSGRLDSEHTLQ